MSSPEETNAGPVIRDLRRIDPRTGQVRSPGANAPGTAARGPGKPGRPGRHSVSSPDGGEEAAGPQGAAGPPEAAGTGDHPAPRGAGQAAEPGGPAEGEREVTAKLAERTADLQRLSAEYANYRKRVDRDRLVVREQALANVLAALLPVLDDIGRAREHGELVGGFEKVAQSLESIVTKLGLVAYGAEGEPFDPNVHEAVSLIQSAGVTEPTCVKILQPGYKVGERIIRPARVIVAEPDDDAGAGDDSGAGAAPSQLDEAGLPDEPADAGPRENRGDED
jgi:molecular chaperone GrpE